MGDTPLGLWPWGNIPIKQMLEVSTSGEFNEVYMLAVSMAAQCNIVLQYCYYMMKEDFLNKLEAPNREHLPCVLIAESLDVDCALFGINVPTKLGLP